MAPNLWTELFFLDEANAFAAGHRPCFECRRDDAKRFKTAWLAGNPQYGFERKVSIGKIDEITHAERIDQQGTKVTFSALVNELPDGTFVLIDNEAYVLADNQLHRWTPFGYDAIAPIPDGNVTVLTYTLHCAGLSGRVPAANGYRLAISLFALTVFDLPFFLR